MNFWLLSASVLTAAIWAIHTFLGGVCAGEKPGLFAGRL